MRKAKIRCAGIIGKGLNPYAVITATVHRETVRTTYVYLEHEARTELSYQLREYGFRAPNRESMDLVRTHAIDVETGKVDLNRLRQRASWINAESLWVAIHANVPGPHKSRHEGPTDMARMIVAALASWRERYPENQSRIWAPNWHVLTACRAVALAAGIPLESGVL